MHYCIHLFTTSKPTESEIAKIMAPFHEDNNTLKSNMLLWDWYTIGGRFSLSADLKAGRACSMAPVRELDYVDMVRRCWAFIDPEGYAVCCEIWLWDRYLTNPHFEEQYEKVFERNAAGYLTVIDIHD